MLEEKVQAVKVEVQRLPEACFIKEVTYPEWLSNVVMVKKKNGKWGMFTDFTDINKCYMKDDFALARIVKIVDSAAPSGMMALLDCFSGYHQIWFWPRDEENISFITPFGSYYYLRMSDWRCSCRLEGSKGGS
jgi:hypothetical protein